MKKKVVLVLLMATLLAGGVFAQEKFFSAGAGISLTPTFGSWEMLGTTIDKSGFDFGINAFFDAKYAELNVGILFGIQKLDIPGSSREMNTATLTLGLIGKYPFSIGDKFVIFPFVGLDYSINLSAKQDGDDVYDDASDRAEYFNNLSLLLGVGFDYNLTEAIYLRLKAGYGIVFNTKTEQDLDDIGVTVFNGKIPISLAVGFRF